MLRRWNLVAGLVAGLTLTACASGPATMAPAPQPVMEQPAAQPEHRGLQPSQGAVSAADHAELTGIELGTMWTFENPPKGYWRERYGFDATDAWLDHVRLSSVRYASFCSASFVSPDGLVMTNHHCGRSCTEAVSPPDSDYVANGFYAPTRADEKECPGVFLDQLVEIQDVTARVQGAAPEGLSPMEVADAMQAERDAIEDACEEASDYHCQVVSLFHGGQYQLYKYRRYNTVKLVFAPELQAGFYGGDPDNFTYPRWALDITFVRAYGPDGAPAPTPEHFGWNPDGADEGDLVFVTGNPGSTSRQATVAQLLYEQQARHPFIVELLAAQEAYLLDVASRGPEAERAVRQQLFGVENSLKLYRGQLEGLRDTLLMGQKIKWEREFRAKVNADPQLQRMYGSVWDSIATIATRRAELYATNSLANAGFMTTPRLNLAARIVRFARQMSMPEAERDSAYRADVVDNTREAILSQQLPPTQAVEPIFRSRLQLAKDWIDPGTPLYRAFLGRGTVDEASGRLMDETGVGDRANREALLDGGMQAVRTSTDPMVHAAFVMDSIYQVVEVEWQGLGAALSVQEERLAKALFAAFGTDLPPDATFTLRITDGVVQRYPYNGTYAAPFTTFYGLYDRSAAFDDEMPWTLPDAFREREADVDMSARLDFVSTNDITGGNSGSPIIDRDGRVVGIAFDGNIEQLPNEFLFRDDAGRTVGVSSEGITEALRSVYQADALVRELVGSARQQ